MIMMNNLFDINGIVNNNIDDAESNLTSANVIMDIVKEPDRLTRNKVEILYSFCKFCKLTDSCVDNALYEKAYDALVSFESRGYRKEN